MANKGLYGYPLPPNAPTRVAPPEWRSTRDFTTPGAYTMTVPQNVFQLYVLVIGAGGSGGAGGANNGGLNASGGGGGGFACGIIDVVPGQVLPTIIVGAGGASVSDNANTPQNGLAGGTSSFGSLLSASGGGAGAATATVTATLSGGSGGVGSANLGLRGGALANGGRGGSKLNTANAGGQVFGGGAAGTIFGQGGNGGDSVASATSVSSSVTGGGAIALGHAPCVQGSSAMYLGGGGFGVPLVEKTLASFQYLGGNGTLAAGGENSGGNGLLVVPVVSAVGASGSSFMVGNSKYSLLDFLTLQSLYNGSGGAPNVTPAGSSPQGGSGGFGAGGGAAGSATGFPARGGCGGVGGGGGAARGVSSGLPAFGGAGGHFAGGGGTFTINGLSSGGNGGFGGGGAGACSSSAAASGSGGSGLVVIAWTEGY